VKNAARTWLPPTLSRMSGRRARRSILADVLLGVACQAGRRAMNSWMPTIMIFTWSAQ
jgi:hypothetical protein